LNPFENHGVQNAAGCDGTRNERGLMRLRQSDCLQGKKEIRKENSDLSYLYKMYKVRLFTKYKSYLIIPLYMVFPYSIIFFFYSIRNGRYEVKVRMQGGGFK